MLLKNNGFILAELLLSLSALFMTSLSFTPLLIDLSKQTRQIQIEKQATQFLYEELQGLINNGQPSADHTTIHNGIVYQVSWRNTGITGQKEVCVKVDKKAFLPETEICSLSE
jgi:competence protein ComGE